MQNLKLNILITLSSHLIKTVFGIRYQAGTDTA